MICRPLLMEMGKNEPKAHLNSDLFEFKSKSMIETKDLRG